MFQPDENRAQPGDIIEFQRGKTLLQGEVLPSNGENTVMVIISSNVDLDEINNGFPKTVVGHSNYRVVEKKRQNVSSS